MSSPVCPLCADTSATLYHLEKFQHNYKCPTCDLVFVPAVDHVTAEREQEIYLLHENHIENEGYVAMFRRALAEVFPYCSPSTILDYGCGYEPVLQQILQRDGYSCDIYDPYFFPQLPDGPYDLIISTEAFEHFSNPAHELERIIQRLKPGGTLAVMTRLFMPEIDFATWHYMKDETHITFYSPRCFEWIAQKYGLSVRHHDGRAVTVLVADK